MKKHTRIIAGVVIGLALVVLAVVIAFPQVAATRFGYFDVNNGRKKVELVIFGCHFRRSIEDTEYSKLLKKLGFKEASPDWKLATQEEMGIRRLFYTQYVDYYMGKIEADSRLFALTIELNKFDEAKAREISEHFRTLVQKGDSVDVRNYVILLSQKNN